MTLATNSAIPLEGRPSNAAGPDWLRQCLEPAAGRFRSTPLHVKLASGNIGTAEYAELLASLWTAYGGLEHRLFMFAPRGVLEALPQLRASLLLEDLATLRAPGVLKPVMKSSPHPPAIHNVAHAIGAAFAMELIDLEAGGIVSALYGNPAVCHALAFFRHCAAQSVWRWPVAELIARRAAQSEKAGIVEGAEAAFEALIGRTAVRAPGSSRVSAKG
jgi:heme oxygenase